MNSKAITMPCPCYYHDEKEEHLRIELGLPGVDKKDIKLEMRKDSFCLSAPTEHIEYSGCFMLGHEVVPEKTEVKFENGLLIIFTPIKDWE